MSGNQATKPPVVTPSFKLKTVEGAALDSTGKIFSGIPQKMTAANFISRYLTLDGGATASVTGTVGGNVATGSTLKITADGKTLAEYTISVKGDTDMNGKVNSTDALAVLQYSVGATTLGPARRLSGDMTGDGKLNSTDALAILQFVVNGGV